VRKAPAFEKMPWDGYEWVEGEVLEKCKNVERLFYSKLAGASYPNLDGSSRMAVLEQCEPGEELKLKTGTAPQYPDSIAVCRKDGSQLGYLESLLAGEVKRNMASGGRWRCFLQRPTFAPDSKKLVGAALCMVRLEDE
jgi:hypothetical protein